jgi:hypothetical protein
MCSVFTRGLSDLTPISMKKLSAFSECSCRYAYRLRACACYSPIHSSDGLIDNNVYTGHTYDPILTARLPPSCSIDKLEAFTVVDTYLETLEMKSSTTVVAKVDSSVP